VSHTAKPFRTLIVSQWYPPEPLRHLGELAGALKARGHEIDVLTGFPHYPGDAGYPGYRRRLWMRERLDGASVVRVPETFNHQPSLVRRVAKYGSFAASAAVLGPWLLSRPDVIYVYATPLTAAVPAELLRRWWDVPMVLHVQDLWPESLEATGAVLSPKALSLVSRGARYLYDRAAAVIVISRGFRTRLLESGVPERKLHLISNWIDTDAASPAVPDPALAETYGLTGRFNVMFAGVMGRAQGLDTVIEAARLLKDDAEVQFVFLGSGVDTPKLRALADGYGLTNVRFIDRQPEARMPAFFAHAGALLVHLRRDPVFRLTIPHKVFGYMASGRPVLAAVNEDTADVVLNAGAGVACDPESPVALAAAVTRLRGMSPEERERLGDNGRRAACRDYSATELTARIGEVLEHVARDAHRST
jgi:colanic acid biosynthesis glycosyl transferase WcaI